MADYFSEMRLFDEAGNRLYLNDDERARFLEASADETRECRVFCSALHHTGCRISEALELFPDRIQVDDSTIVFRTLKKRRLDHQGNEKVAEYRAVPVDQSVIELFDLVFDLRRRRRRKETGTNPFWTMHRTTAWRMVKRVMARAGIVGPQATAKGLRHGFGVAMVSGPAPIPLHTLADVMGHASAATTEIYTRVLGGEKHRMVMRAWQR